MACFKQALQCENEINDMQFRHDLYSLKNAEKILGHEEI